MEGTERQILADPRGTQTLISKCYSCLVTENDETQARVILGEVVGVLPG